MGKNFENNIVLTSQNPEAFLVFDYEGVNKFLEPSINLADNLLYINGWRAQTINDASSAGLNLTSATSVAPFHLYTNSKEDFDYNISFISSQDEVLLTSWDNSNWNGQGGGTGPNVSGRDADFGDYFESNTFNVVGGSSLDFVMDMSTLFGILVIPEFIIYENGTPDTSTVYTLSSGVNTFSINVSDNTTSVFLRLYEDNPGGSVVQFDCDCSVFGSSFDIIDVSVFNRPFLLSAEDFNQYETGEALVEGEASYLLLRTNPKYSGNIKLVMDVSDNIYLDTFKVSDILSNKKYRKQRVSGSSYLSGDIRTVFGSLPSGEIFRVDDQNTLDLTHPKTVYSDQYNMEYSYGSRIFIDELYEEEYAMLAPLWINSKLPDYFAIFRLDSIYNPETYQISPDLDSLANDFIINGNLIESWNLKENQPIGKYLNNHLEELLNVESPVNLSLNEYDPNTWTGMTVDKGIIAGRSEVPYFFQKTTSNFTNTNAFVSQGFERQNLLMPNLLNMEFIFNDADVSRYSMHRYFGLYLTENELYEFYYYKEEDDSSVNIVSLDGKDVYTFIDSSVFSGGNISTAYENRIFVINDGDELTRICCTDQFDTTDPSAISPYVNKLGTNIFNTYVEKKDINTFISFTLTNPLYQGEHLRIINNNEFKIWEIYGTASDIFEAGEAGPYVSFNEPEPGYPIVYRTAFSTKGDVSDQIQAIAKAFCSFNNYEDAPFHTGMTKEDGMSIILNDNADHNNYSFQRITSQIAFNIGEPSSAFNGTATPGDFVFYGNLMPDASDYFRIPSDASFGPIDLELYGDRLTIILNMFDPAGYYIYSFDASTTNLFTDHILYQSTDGLNRIIQDFDISTGINNYALQYSEDPTTTSNNAIVITTNEISIDEDNYWWGYDVHPIYVSLMGINPVKDFDFTVYDSSTNGMDFKSTYWNNREGDEATYQMTIGVAETKVINERNSYEIIAGAGTITIDSSIINYNTTGGNFFFNTFFGEATIYSTGNTVVTYNELDGSHTYPTYKSGVSEESIYDYYVNNVLIDGSGNSYPNYIELKYGLVVPTISKWGGTGKDVRNNPMRLLLTSDLFDSSVSSNFLASTDISTYNSEISYPIFKYLSAGGDNWKDYVYYDINDVIDTDTGRKTVRQLMVDEPYTDVFSKIIYNNNEIPEGNLRSSILYYNLYENKVITLIKGIKLGFEVTATGEQLFNVTNWNRYRFSFISSPSRNIETNNPIEVIINENTKTILMIWYQGSDILSYTKRWSNTIGGKSALIDQNSIDDIRFEAFFTGDPSYSYIKAPFIVNTSSTISPTINLYDISTNYSDYICNPFAQFSYNNRGGVSSIFNAYRTSGNTVINNVFNFGNISFNTFDQNEVNYTYLNNTISYGSDISNVPYHYSDNVNYYKDKACDFDTFEYFIDNNNVRYLVIQEDQIITSDVFSSPPLNVTIFDPIEYSSPNSDSSIYIYNGGYKPIFNNILNFNNNESTDIINIVEKDFIFANTDLASYDKIPQYWYNKVVDVVRAKDSSNNIGYQENFNPFKSQWDGNYYILDNNGVQTDIDGYNAMLEVPSFFGSKLVSLPQELVLENWNASNSTVVTGVDYYSLQYNLTKAIVDLFTSNYTFISNWSTLPTVGDEVINRYIIKTILNYYNISIDKIKVAAYSKDFSSSILVRTNDGSFTTLLENIDSTLTTVNNEYVYKIKYNKEDLKSYYTKFTFTKK